MSNEIIQNDVNELEKMRYNNNSLSYKLGFGGITCSVIAAFLALNSFGPSDISTVIKVLMNILVLLIGFLATEKVKVYKKEYSYVMFTLGGVCAARIFWVPLQLFIYWNKYVSLYNSKYVEYNADLEAQLETLLNKQATAGQEEIQILQEQIKNLQDQIHSNAELALGTAVSKYKDKLSATVLGEVDANNEISTTGYLFSNGNARAIVIIVFLGLAAACFITSGLVNLHKSHKLNAYLATVEKK